MAPELVAGPYFDDLAVGDRFDGAPGVTLTGGQAALHQAVVGDRMRLPLDEQLARDVVGAAPLAHPALVWDVAIGQSTVVTQRVKANLFYRGLGFHRFPLVGDTLRTSTEVAGLRQNRRRPERAPTGLAVLRIHTTDQDDRPVLDFWRCAMLPLRDPDRDTGHQDELDRIGTPFSTGQLADALAGWRLDRFRTLVPGEHFDAIEAGRTWRVAGADTVSSAPELARLTLNIAAVHHDEAAAGGRRLVYGGHPIGLALAQVCRAIPNIVTVAGWDGCDHVGPVHEGDALVSEILVERKEPLPSGGGMLRLRVSVDARSAGEVATRPVLLWRFGALLA